MVSPVRGLAGGERGTDRVRERDGSQRNRSRERSPHCDANPAEDRPDVHPFVITPPRKTIR